MRTLIYMAGTTLLLAAAGCSSDPNATSNNPVADRTPQPSPPSAASLDCSTLRFQKTSDVDAMPGGIWLGSLVDCAYNVQYDEVIAMVSEDGRFRVLGANEHLLAGALQTEGNLFRGDGIDFAPTGLEYFSGPSTSLFVEGTIAEGETLQGRWGTEWGSYGYFDFVYVQQSYERTTMLADLSGAWSLAVNYSAMPHQGIWTIEPDGRFDGQDDAGCLQSGQFSLIDDRYSIFAVEFDVTGCDRAGSYSGLALYEDLVDWWEKSITVSADNGTRALRMGLAIPRP